jgi:hypothetical protein
LKIAQSGGAFLATLWLVIAMWAVDTGIAKLMDVIALGP